MLGKKSSACSSGLGGYFDVKSPREIKVSLIYGIKSNPYVGFSLSAPRERNVPEVYYSINGPSNRLVMDFRFFADTFSLEYRHLSKAEIDDLDNKIDTSRAKGRITSAKLTTYPGEKPLLIGYRWVGKLGTPDEGVLYAALDHCLERGKFEVLAISAADSNLRGTARALALKGYKEPMIEWRDVWGNTRTFMPAFQVASTKSFIASDGI
jgi:hypothetical protein